MHAPQTPEARAEAAELLNVKQCIMSTQTNRPMMGVVYDALSGAYLMTQAETMVDPDTYMDCLAMMTSRDQLPTLDDRLARYQVRPFSGRALFSGPLPEDFQYTKGKVIIKDGVLIQGEITKAHIGVTSNSIIQFLYKEYGSSRTSDFLTDISFIENRWLIDRGLSIGLRDCYPKDARYKQQVDEAIEKARLEVAALGVKLDDPLEEEQREKKIVGYVSAVKNLSQTLVADNLAPDNNLAIMSDLGSSAKGSKFNIAQIIGLLGQQFIKGERMKMTLTHGTRCLPYFEENDASIEARGFCVRGFGPEQGLSPAEYMFHAAGSREGLMDTAVKTAETGSLHHRLVKSVEDLKVVNDGSLRNATGIIFQYTAYEHGFEPSEMMGIPGASGGGDLVTFFNPQSLAAKINARYGYT